MTQHSDANVRTFLGWLSADIPELRSVEVPRLADSWERFKALRPEHVADDAGVCLPYCPACAAAAVPVNVDGDVITICGVRYALALFQHLGIGQVGSRIEILAREDGALTLRQLPNDSTLENGLTAADYEEVLADHRRLVRELDVLLNGDGAAHQATLGDIVAQLAREKGQRPQTEARA